MREIENWRFAASLLARIIREGRSLRADSRDKFQEKYVLPLLPTVESTPWSRARRIRPHRRVPSFRRTLMRKISKRRSSSSLADPLNRQEWSRMAVLQGRSGSIPFRTTRNESFSTRVKTNESLKSSLHFLSVESRTVLRGCDSRDWRIFVICRKD